MSVSAISSTLPNNNMYRQPSVASPAQSQTTPALAGVFLPASQLLAPSQAGSQASANSSPLPYTPTSTADLSAVTAPFSEPSLTSSASIAPQTPPSATASVTSTVNGTTTDAVTSFHQLVQNVLNPTANASPSGATGQQTAGDADCNGGPTTAASGVGSTSANVAATDQAQMAAKTADPSTLV